MPFGSDDKRALTQPASLATKVLQIGREGKGVEQNGRSDSDGAEEGSQDKRKVRTTDFERLSRR